MHLEDQAAAWEKFACAALSGNNLPDEIRNGSVVARRAMMAADARVVADDLLREMMARFSWAPTRYNAVRVADAIMGDTGEWADCEPQDIVQFVKEEALQSIRLHFIDLDIVLRDPTDKDLETIAEVCEARRLKFEAWERSTDEDKGEMHWLIRKVRPGQHDANWVGEEE